MKSLWIFTLLLLPILLVAQVGISFSFANAQITPGGDHGYYEFDIIAAGESPQNLIATQVLFNYSTTAFGTWINEGQVTVTSGLAANYILTVNDSYENVISMAQNLRVGTPFILPVTEVMLYHVKILIADPTASAGISFNTLMEGNQFFIDDDYNYIQYTSPITYGAGLDETLPVELSSFTAMINSQNYVSLNWITQSETGVIGFNVYRSAAEDLEFAELVSPLIPASNTSSTQSYLFVDRELYEPGFYYYWLENVDMDGRRDMHGPISINYSGAGSNHIPGINPVDGINQTYPNPFNPNVWISFGLTHESKVDMAIYNMRGQLISQLVNEDREAGSYRVVWNGNKNDGTACGSGVYILRLNAGGKSYSSRLILVK